jgi:hypothetical protein
MDAAFAGSTEMSFFIPTRLLVSEVVEHPAVA